jgi:DeoR family transcriptional regulator, aga operon transcriptional repressor
MLASDRRNRILERVAEDQSLHITQLAQELNVSEMTVRRDIARLERNGFLRRTYGGATTHLTRSLDPSFNPRVLENAQAKRLIGVAAARLLSDAATMFVGVGTTTEQFARFLPARSDLTVITESLPIATFLGTRPLRVVVLGGTVLTDELTCVGPAAMATLGRYRADVAVIGAAGLSLQHGLTELREEEADNHRVMIERSDRIVVLADGSKLGARAMAQVAPATAVSVLVTNEGAPEQEVRALRDAGVDVVIAMRSDARHRRDGDGDAAEAGRAAAGGGKAEGG